MKPGNWLILPLLYAGLAIPSAAQTQPTKSIVVEEIVARVNNEIITREDLEKARGSLEGEVRDACPNCTPEQFKVQLETKEKDLLRDLIDQSLLVQKAKDDGINVDTDVIKRLDAIRQQNKLPDMDALEREVTKTGVDFEDFKGQIRDQLLTQELIRKEVGSKIITTHEEVVKYYNEHKSEFIRPETVYLREIFVSTEGKPAADIPALKKKAQNLRDRVINNGDDFGEMAKRYSDSPTAQQEGDLGSFQRNQLDPKIADKVFALNHGDMTEVMETKTGFEVLQVRERYEAGEQPLDKVEPEISNKMYEQKMEPGLRAYLTTLREDSYVQIKPGYTDTAAVKAEPIEEVAAAPDKDDPKNKPGKKWGIFPKKNPGT